MAKTTRRAPAKSKAKARPPRKTTARPKQPAPPERIEPAPIRTPRTIDISGAASIWQRELIRFFRERSRVLTSFVQPLMYLLVFGSGLAGVVSLRAGGIGRPGGGAPDFRVFLLPGVIGMTILFTAMFGGMSVVWDREFGFLKEILVSPVSRPAVIAGKVSGGATTSTIQGLAILIFAPIVGLHLSVLHALEVVPVMVLFALATNLLGVAIASRTQTMQSFFVIQNFVMLPMLFLSGSIYPLGAAPAWLRAAATIDPATYAIDAIRGFLLAGPPFFYQHIQLFSGFQLNPGVDAIVLAVLAAALFFFAVRGINRQP